MKILRSKNFTAGRRGDKEWEENSRKEAERNKERDELLKKSTPHEIAVSGVMWEDTDNAGRGRYRRNQIKSGLAGATIGSAAGYGVSRLLEKKGYKKAPLIATGGILGAGISKAITRRKNVRIGEKIWDSGDKEVMDYLKSSKKDKKKIEKDYKPIGWRVNRKGDYLEKDKEFPYDKSINEDRFNKREAYIKAMESYKTFLKNKKK